MNQLRYTKHTVSTLCLGVVSFMSAAALACGSGTKNNNNNNIVVRGKCTKREVVPYQLLTAAVTPVLSLVVKSAASCRLPSADHRYIKILSTKLLI